MASISLQSIVKRYAGDVVAVKDFNLEIEDKEFIIFVGPSGCGKSTTLRMIAGLEEISEGKLYIGSKLVNDVHPKDRDIAMVFQNYALYPHMTVFKNMAFALKLRKVPKDVIEQKVREVAKILDIEHLLNRKPKALSGGQRQRVALGRAMVRNPAVFLLDEPLSNLDAKLRNTMRTEITKLHKQLQTTFVYVTHDQTEAMTMGDRIVVMKDGLIQQVDTPQNLYDRPVSTFVAGFIGTPQMNFLTTAIEKENGRYAVNKGGKVIILPESKGGDDIFAPYEGKEVIIGLRPENIYFVDGNTEEDPGRLAEATVDICEMMGSEIYLHLECMGEKLIARIPSKYKITEGEKIKINLDIEKLHIFNKETQQVICN